MYYFNLDLNCMIRFLGPRRNTLKIPTRDPDSTSRERGQLVAIKNSYRGADKSLARPGRKQATATEDFEFNISYLLS